MPVVPESGGAESGVWSVSTLFALYTEISIKDGSNKIYINQTSFLLEMDILNEQFLLYKSDGHIVTLVSRGYHNKTNALITCNYVLLRIGKQESIENGTTVDFYSSIYWTQR